MKPIMYLLRAMPGAGKSTLINRFGLKSNTISLDTFRELFSGLSLDKDGNEGIDQKYNQHIMKYFWDAVYFRMKEKSTIFIDNLNLNVSDINEYVKIANSYGYDVRVVNFPLESFEFYVERNKNREKRKQIPIDKLKEIYSRFQNTDLTDSKAEILNVEGFEFIMSLSNEDKAIPLDKYNEVVIYGDIYGAGKSFNNINQYFDPNKFYIFTGKLFSDSEGNNSLLHSLILASEMDNVVFLKNNHDTGFVYGDDSVLNDIEKLDYGKIINKSLPYFIFSYYGQFYFSSHAGVPKIPVHIEKLNTSIFTKTQDDKNIDNTFNSSHEHWIQVYSGRNNPNLNTKSGVRSFSLCDNVEKGGYLCSMSLIKKNRYFSKILNHQVSLSAVNNFYQELFKKFDNTTDLDISSIKKLNKYKQKGKTECFKDDTNIYYIYNNDIVRVERSKHQQTTVSFNKSEKKYLSFSKTNDSFLLINKDGFEDLKPIESIFDKQLLDLIEYNDLVVEVLFFDNNYYPVSGYRKDFEKNKVKPKYFEDAPIKFITFDNEKSFNYFKKGMNKSNKEYFII